MNIQMQKVQQGFTLIELMIVVAIIGILAAIAIPAYQDYLARAQAAEAPSLLGGLKTGIAEYYSLNGAVPSVAQLPGSVTEGKYVASITGTGGASGDFVATYRPVGSVNAKLGGQTVTMTFNTSDASFSWACTLAAEVKPSVCP